GASIDSVADLTVTGSEPGAHLGAWAGSGGDVDGDGERDFVVGAPGDDVDGNGLEDNLDRGRVLFYRGGAFLNPTADHSLEGGLENGAGAGTSGA
ncbi:MAG TPA: hypothetical protein VFC86_10550, partial [Planctomycetota bacterium]|nr:hypothetical protein [Planctomycetota bacterium]